MCAGTKRHESQQMHIRTLLETLTRKRMYILLLLRRRLRRHLLYLES